MSLPGGSNAFPFGNYFLKGALNSFRLRFRAEQFLRAPDLSFVQHVVFVPAFAVGASHILLSFVLKPVYKLLRFMYTGKFFLAVTPGLFKLAVDDFELLSQLNVLSHHLLHPLSQRGDDGIL